MSSSLSFAIPQLPTSSQPPAPPAGPSSNPSYRLPSSLPPPSSLSLPNQSSPLAHQQLPYPPSSSHLPSTTTPRSSLPPSRRQSVSNGTGKPLPAGSPNGAGGSGVASGSGAGRAGPAVNGAHGPGMVDDKSREERILTEGIRSSVHLALAFDQLSALHPDTSPFQSPSDIVERLLPYHVFQIPNEDLVPPSILKKASAKGKGRAREWELEALLAEDGALEEETEEEERARLKEVISFAKRKRSLEKRFKKVRLAEGNHASPTPQTIFLARASIDNELAAMTAARALTNQARSNYEYLEKRLSYQVQGIPWSDELNPPPPSLYPQHQQQQQQHQQQPSRPNFPSNSNSYSSYQPGTPQYYQQRAQQQQQQQQQQQHYQNQQNNFRPNPSSSSSRPPPPRTGAPPGVDLNAAVPLSLPGTTVPTLVELGLISGTGGADGLTSDVRVEGTNVCFTIVLSKLNANQLQGLAKLLNAVGGGGVPAGGGRVGS